MVQQVDYATQLPQYDMMIRSVLKAGHVFRTSPDYDDYYQELRLIILLQTGAVDTFPPLARTTHFIGYCFGDYVTFNGKPSGMVSIPALSQLTKMSKICAVQTKRTVSELHQVLAKLVTREKNKSDLERVIIDLIKYPTDTITNRCARLSIHRATYARWLKQIRLLMLDVTA